LPFLLICRRCGFATVATREDATAKMRWHSDAHLRAERALPEWRKIVIRWADYEVYRVAMQQSEFWRAYLARRHP
jgi:hypothetical protein